MSSCDGTQHKGIDRPIKTFHHGYFVKNDNHTTAITDYSFMLPSRHASTNKRKHAHAQVQDAKQNGKGIAYDRSLLTTRHAMELRCHQPEHVLVVLSDTMSVAPRFFFCVRCIVE